MKPARTSERERYAMNEDTSIVELRQPGAVDDPLTEIAREGARRMLASALEAEVEAFLDRHADDRLPDGRRRVVRHGHGPERSIQTGIGALEVGRPKGRDRAREKDGADRVRFTSSIRPRWRGGRAAWTRRCRFFTCGACPRATSGRPWPHSWAPMLRTCRPGRSRG